MDSNVEDNPNIDRISQLPDEILHLILCKIEIDYSVRTSILSRRWRNLWCTNSVLDFSSSNFSDRFINRIDIFDRLIPTRNYFGPIKVYCLSQCSSVERLHFIKFDLNGSLAPSSTLARFFRFAADRGIRSLEFSAAANNPDLQGRPYCDPYGDPFGEAFIDIPLSLFECQSLSSLVLSHHLSIPSIPAGKKFCALKILSLSSININNEALAALLFACPNIEDLSIDDCMSRRIVIRSHTLKKLKIASYAPFFVLEFAFAPQLCSFTYTGYLSAIRSLENAQNLENLTLSEILGTMLSANNISAVLDSFQSLQFLYSIPSIKVLTVGHWGGFDQYISTWNGDSHPQQSVVLKLKELHWDGGDFWKNDLCMFFSILRASPFLEKLYIHSEFPDCPKTGGRRYDNVRELMKQVEGFNNFFPNLRSVSVLHTWGDWHELRLLEFVVRKAPVLQSVALVFHSETQHYSMDKITEVVCRFHKASPLANISFIKPQHPTLCPRCSVPAE